MESVTDLATTSQIGREQRELVRKTYAVIEPFSDLAGALFYGRLFEIAPDVRPLFKADLEEQGKKLMQMIGVAVAHLDDLESITPAIKALGMRHAGYGVVDEHYDSVGAALLWTLEQGLGEGFTPEVNDAWRSVYSTLANTMKRAVHDHPA